MAITITAKPAKSGDPPSRRRARRRAPQRVPVMAAAAPPPDSPANAAGETEAPSAAALYRLQAWLSPSYPVGAFAFSGGLEWAVAAGDVHDAETLRQWLTTLLRHGAGFCDAVF